ncbi:MAG: hypothetical protein QN122_03035 [Armatimonadota bacterium]|nr:hypothetical protein [Armatimonadota bacterium]
MRAPVGLGEGGGLCRLGHDDGQHGVRIAVVDTGVDNSHEDLPAVVAQRDFVNNDSNAEDDNGTAPTPGGSVR